jgi:replication factor C small subunit
MKKISESTLWVERYRPQTLEDMILPARIKEFFDKVVAGGEIPNMILTSTAGKGKTSVSNALCNELGADKLFINASIDNSIDNIRYKVQNFATSASFSDGTKIVVMDECERITAAGQDSLKALIEQVERNCRFIFTCNNYSKVIDPLKSRCQTIDFNFTPEDMKELVVKIFHRCAFILKNEGIEYEKEVLAEFVKKQYPDIRKTINTLQKFVNTHGKIDSNIFKFNDSEGVMNDLITSLKTKKFNDVRKIASAIDPSSFYGDFYRQIDTQLKDESKPDIILILAQFAYETGLSVDQEISLVGCLIQIMKSAQWR